MTARGGGVLLEAMKAAGHAAPEPHRAGHRPGGGAPGVAEPERLVADEPDVACAARAQQPLA